MRTAKISLLALLVLIPACTKEQRKIAGLSALAAAGRANKTATALVKTIDVRKQEQYRQRITDAQTEEQATAVKKEQEDHTKKRDACYAIFELVNEKIIFLKRAILNDQVDITELLALMAKVKPVLVAFGVDDPIVLAAFDAASILGGQ